MTSAVRDAANGAEFAARVQEAPRVPRADPERRGGGAADIRRRAREDEPVLVIDIGGGSTELVLGARGEVSWHASTQIGVVRHSERHLHTDPPTRDELAALRADVQLPRAPARDAARSPSPAHPPSARRSTSELDEYDPERIEGHVLTVDALQAMLDRLSVLPLAQLRETRGLDPARAPVIVAGIAILLEVLAAFGLDRVEASERDILWGLALSTASKTQ